MPEVRKMCQTLKAHERRLSLKKSWIGWYSNECTNEWTNQRRKRREKKTEKYFTMKCQKMWTHSNMRFIGSKSREEEEEEEDDEKKQNWYTNDAGPE